MYKGMSVSARIFSSIRSKVDHPSPQAACLQPLALSSSGFLLTLATVLCTQPYVFVVFQSPIVSDDHDLSTPGLPIHHSLLEFAQAHVHRTHAGPAIASSDALSPFCPQSFPASRTFPMSHLVHTRWPNTCVYIENILYFNSQSINSCWFGWLWVA